MNGFAQSRILKAIFGMGLLGVAVFILWAGGRAPATLLLFPSPLDVSIDEVISGTAPVSSLVRLRGRFVADIAFTREITGSDREGRERYREEEIFSLFRDGSGGRIYVVSDYPPEILAARYAKSSAITGIVRAYDGRDSMAFFTLWRKEGIDFSPGGRYIDLVGEGNGHFFRAVMQLMLIMAVAGAVVVFSWVRVFGCRGD